MIHIIAEPVCPSAQRYNSMRLNAFRWNNRAVMIRDLNAPTKFTVRVRIPCRIIDCLPISNRLALAIAEEKFVCWLLLVVRIRTPGPERIAPLHWQKAKLRNWSSFSPGGAAIDGHLQTNL